MRDAACQNRHDVGAGRERYARHEIELRKAKTRGLKIERVSVDAELFCLPIRAWLKSLTKEPER
jgi:hypothetical protein